MQQKPIRKIDRVLALSLTPLLKEAGFRKSGHTFRLLRDGVWQVLGVQGSWSSPAEGAESFTINLGIHSKRVEQFAGQDFGNRGPVAGMCALNIRAGHLRKANTDHWWYLETDSDVAAVAEELREEWVCRIRPWFERGGTEEGALAIAESESMAGPSFLFSLALGQRNRASRWWPAVAASYGGEWLGWYQRIARTAGIQD